ncbi:MAG: transglycosylase family protein [Actinomycetota bacterium]
MAVLFIPIALLGVNQAREARADELSDSITATVNAVVQTALAPPPPIPTPEAPNVEPEPPEPQQTHVHPTDSRLAAVAMCESGGSYTAQNPRSSASGKYQMINGTFQGTKAGKQSGYKRAKDAPPEVQEAAAIELWDNGRGASHWSESRRCWG